MPNTGATYFFKIDEQLLINPAAFVSMQVMHL